MSVRNVLVCGAAVLGLSLVPSSALADGFSLFIGGGAPVYSPPVYYSPPAYYPAAPVYYPAAPVYYPAAPVYGGPSFSFGYSRGFRGHRGGHHGHHHHHHHGHRGRHHHHH